MARDDIPDHVQAAIARHIDSIQQIEILALIQGEPDRAWTPSELCSSLHLPPAACLEWVNRFTADGIVTTESGTVRYAATNAHSRALQDLVDLYGRRRYSVVAAIYSKPLRS